LHISATNIPRACRNGNIVSNVAMMLPHDSNSRQAIFRNELGSHICLICRAQPREQITAVAIVRPKREIFSALPPAKTMPPR
jgi:hypothetical protein